MATSAIIPTRVKEKTRGSGGGGRRAERLLRLEPGPMRIHVGGLGTGVTGEDLEKTFSSMGKVSRVDLIARPDGRRFAFLDFDPNSDKSMARLFANYNGCTWKGGKLRLEKATEHYIDRLRREWAESREPQSDDCVNDDVTKKSESGRLSKSLALEKMQLKIFFPRLSKVKSLPYKGTGKHKYSFQRVIVPLLPVNFCDCEEHLGSSREVATTKSEPINNLSGFISEKELDVMHSVMSKILTKEAGIKGETEVKLSSPPDGDLQSNHDLQLRVEEEVQVTDDENFVMNIGSGGACATLDSILKSELELLPPVQDLKRKDFDRRGGNKHTQKKQKTGSEKVAESGANKKDPPFQNGCDGVELPDTQSAKQAGSDPPSPNSQYLTEPPSNGTRSNEVPAIDKSDKGASWVQKSSWRDLVGDSHSSSFSIFSVLPGRESMKQDTTKASDLASARNRTDKGRDVPVKPDEVNTRAPRPDCSVPEGEPNKQPRDHEGLQKDDDMTGKTELDDRKEVQDKDNWEKKTETTGPIVVGNTCTFMRTADSRKQWLKAKSSMSSYLKKKSIVKTSSGNGGSRRRGS